MTDRNITLVSFARDLGLSATVFALLNPSICYCQGPTKTYYKPAAPISPMSEQQCNKLADEYRKLQLQVSKDHDACLTAHDKDRQPLSQQAQKGINTCSRQACQHLHDLRSDPYYTGTKEVQACRVAVGRSAKSDAASSQSSAAAQRTGSAAASSQSSPAAQSRGPTVIAAPSSTSSGLAAWQARDQKRKRQEAEIQQRADQALNSGLDEKQRAAVANEAANELDRIYRERKADPKPSAESASTADYSPSQEKAAEYGIEATKRAFDQGARMLENDIASASHQLSGKALRGYLASAEDTKSVFNGMGKMVSAADYLVTAKKIVDADTAYKQHQAEGELGLKAFTDVGKYGLTTVAPKLFGPEMAAVLAGPVGWTAAVATDVMSSTETGRDFAEIIQDTSGRSSMADKQRALDAAWGLYDKYGDKWSWQQKYQLIQLTGLVYRQND